MMKIDILVLNEDQALKKVIEFYRISNLIEKLRKHGFKPKIINKISDIQERHLYLYFTHGVDESDLIKKSSQVVIMNVSMSDLNKLALSHHFAAIVRYWYYSDDAPFIFGFPEVGKQLDISRPEEGKPYDFGQGEVYAIMRPRVLEEKSLVPFLLDYLKVYKELGLDKREGTVVKRKV